MGEVILFPGPKLCGCGRPRAPRRVWCAECAAEADAAQAKATKPRPRWREMTVEERALAFAFAGDPDLMRRSPFAVAMMQKAFVGEPITENMGNAIYAVARDKAIIDARLLLGMNQRPRQGHRGAVSTGYSTLSRKTMPPC
jgi:acyl-CoA reductase-like NAD-dependent aldehyde dehydrogenase